MMQKRSMGIINLGTRATGRRCERLLAITLLLDDGIEDTIAVDSRLLSSVLSIANNRPCRCLELGFVSVREVDTLGH